MKFLLSATLLLPLSMASFNVAADPGSFPRHAGKVAAGPMKESNELRDLKRRALSGDVSANRALGQRYRDGDGVGQDRKEAAKWFTAAAESDDAYSQNELGFALLNGFGVEANLGQAYRWFRTSALAGNADAMENLAYIYGSRNQSGVIPANALACYMAAAQLGSATAKDQIAKLSASAPNRVKAAYASHFLERKDPLKTCVGTYDDKLFG